MLRFCEAKVSKQTGRIEKTVSVYSLVFETPRRAVSPQTDATLGPSGSLELSAGEIYFK
jgi:hypothetical protein